MWSLITLALAFYLSLIRILYISSYSPISHGEGRGAYDAVLVILAEEEDFVLV